MAELADAVMHFLEHARDLDDWSLACGRDVPQLHLERIEGATDPPAESGGGRPTLNWKVGGLRASIGRPTPPERELNADVLDEADSAIRRLECPRLPSGGVCVTARNALCA